jgi:signal transduction histidine kinase
VIDAIKRQAKHYWPALRLRTILLTTLLVTAALPGVGALFLRVYENTLVRQTEAELVAQGAVLAAAARVVGGDWSPPPPEREYQPEPSIIDLRTSPVLDERPRASAITAPPLTDAMTIARTLAPIIVATQRTTLASIQMLDAQGKVVVGHETGGSYERVPEVADALHGKVSTVLRRNSAYSQRYAFEWLSRASSLRIHHVRPIIVNGKIIGAMLLSRSPRALFRGLYEDRGKIMLGIILIFGVLIVLSGLLSRGIARPIATLGKATRSLAVGDAAIPQTPVTAAIEIRELFENFRAMAIAIDHRSRYLRDFAASVSHEFKTPLAGIRGAVELLEDHGETMAVDERRRFLGNIGQDAGRLSQLVTRLLDLARADLARAEQGVAIDAVATARAVADAFEGARCRVSVAAPPCFPPMAVPEATLAAVLTTLVDNACQAGADRAEISMSVEGETLAITVADNGCGVAAHDRERIFESFFTTRRESGGTGLGLAIARSLLGGSGATLALIDRDEGAAFLITAPRAAHASAASGLSATNATDCTATVS